MQLKPVSYHLKSSPSFFIGLVQEEDFYSHHAWEIWILDKIRMQEQDSKSEMSKGKSGVRFLLDV